MGRLFLSRETNALGTPNGSCTCLCWGELYHLKAVDPTTTSPTNSSRVDTCTQRQQQQQQPRDTTSSPINIRLAGCMNWTSLPLPTGSSHYQVDILYHVMFSQRFCTLGCASPPFPKPWGVLYKYTPL